MTGEKQGHEWVSIDVQYSVGQVRVIKDENGNVYLIILRQGENIVEVKVIHPSGQVHNLNTVLFASIDPTTL